MFCTFINPNELSAWRAKPIAVVIGLLLIANAANVVMAQQPIDFNRDVRPLLSENCFFCHGQDANQRQADLRLDIGQAAFDSGAIVPGDTESSLLIERIDDDDPDYMMPPPDSNRRLSAEEKDILRRWIQQGGEYQPHWAFVAPVRPEQPDVMRNDWIRNPIDRFVLANLEMNGLSPSPEADRATLIKRLSIDLTGLPPSIKDVDAFVDDPDPQAYEKLADRLLESSRYGERMAVPWLDAARYSDSNGFQQDGDTWQWIWRDWLVRAFNEDMPFDQFTIWQLAGDLLPEATTDQKIASGFNRNHMLNGEGGAIAEEQRFVNLFDRIDTTATTWLGLTMACAQCHDHKYDPITQKDYYRLLDAFNRLPETGTPQHQSPRIRVARPFIELPTDENKRHIAELEKQIDQAKGPADQATETAFAGWQEGIIGDGNAADLKELTKELTAVLQTKQADRTDEQKKSIEHGLRSHFNQKIRSKLASQIPAIAKYEKLKKQLADYRGDQIPRAMIMSDANPRNSHILDRGEYLKPKEEVSFTTPEFLPSLPDEAPRNRLGLAHWLVSPENPLTARVQVNRMWQYFFGAGIVKSTEDLGVQSEYPVQKELLDWLAVEFRENGWSMKQMHRLIVTSATYRQSSRVTSQQLELDPDNRLYSRAGRFRMPAMILRDWALASSGLLVDNIGGAPVYPYQPDSVWEPLAITKERDFTYPASSGDDLYRRSLYTFWRRTVGPSNMFDASNRQACRVRKSITSTPLHALTTLNDPTWVEAARLLARESLKHDTSIDRQLVFAFRRVLCRQPTAQEIERLQKAHEKQLEIYKDDADSAKALLSVGETPRDENLATVEHAVMTAVCLAILNLDEALTRE